MHEPIPSAARRRRSSAATRTLTLATLVWILSNSTPASATARSSDGEIARCIARAADGKDWLEKSLWGLRDQEGGWTGAEIANANGSHDLGPLQINSLWVPKIAAVLRQPEQDVRAWLKSDACFNAAVARWIFLSALRSTGDYWAAIGVYHSPTAWRQRRYALSVADHLTRRFGPAIFGGRTGKTSGAEANRPTGSAPNQVSKERMLGFGVVTRTAASEVRD